LHGRCGNSLGFAAHFDIDDTALPAAVRRQASVQPG
jgi:hypothetical protein